MDVAIKEKMVKLFNIAYFIAKEEVSFTMFPKLVALHQTNGLDLGSTYSNDQTCRIFITAICSCFFEELQQSLKSARFFSIMSDSSVDRSVKDQELIYCTYLQNGKPVNQLIQIVVLDHANSQGILDAILAGLLKVGVGEGDLKKQLVGFGCDGASVMLGMNNGVTARLQRLCPSLVPICDPNDKEASAAMKGRAKLVQQSLKQYKMLLFIHLMLDVLQELKQLSLLFQRDSLTLQIVSDGLQTTTLALVAMQLSRTNADDDTFNALKLRLTNSFCEFVSERFKSLETGVLKATSTLFDLSNWPENTTDLATFGTAELNAFMEHFHPVLETCEDFESVEAARREWLDLKVLIARHYRHLDSQVLWQRLIQCAIGKDGQ
ncbi:hypothetical protein AAFF_G00344320 [Aldrovandia affinis]|uniref:DUF4371 domain-containing protein n=1 Tax=Aldrovandia affinis TaxID=143900 RepID=A0AAD7WP36_9TELE|nr:hypothetical protein AAFF_G00344320 [Aldrovandia affinis]